MPVSQEGSSTFGDLSLQQNLLFSESLMDLKNLRSQLYFAAEYFELSYSNDDQKQIVVETSKDYALKALVNIVDHLGSLSHKVNGLLSGNAHQVSKAGLRVSCIEQALHYKSCKEPFKGKKWCQRLHTCRCIDHAGLSWRSSAITTPKYHKQYIIPVGEHMPGSGKHAVAYSPEFHVKDNNESQLFQDGIHLAIKARATSFRKGRSGRSPSSSLRVFSSSSSQRTLSPSPSPLPGKFHFPGSPFPTSNPILYSHSRYVSTRPMLCNFPSTIQRFPMEIRKSSSVQMQANSDQKDLGKNPSKSKSFLKSLFNKRKNKNDDMFYTYLDEY